MYNKITSLLLILLLFASPVLACGDMMEPPTVILPYVIEKIENSEYYGTWKDGTKIHFTVEDIVTDDEILIGDTVLATFNREDLDHVLGVEFFYREAED